MNLPVGFLRLLLRDFVYGGMEKGRADEEIREALRCYAVHHSVQNVDEVLDIAFSDATPVETTAEPRTDAAYDELLAAEVRYLEANGWRRDTLRRKSQDRIAAGEAPGWVEPPGRGRRRRRVLAHNHAVNAQKYNDRRSAVDRSIGSQDDLMNGQVDR